VLEEMVEPRPWPQVLCENAQDPRASGLTAVLAGVQEMDVDLVKALLAQQCAELAR
jgi:hypothetical protein